MEWQPRALQHKTLNEIKICNKSWNGQKTCKTWNEVGLTFWINTKYIYILVEKHNQLKHSLLQGITAKLRELNLE